jgi:glycosyltransferase involved in cell wall biosynthesis
MSEPLVVRMGGGVPRRDEPSLSLNEAIDALRAGRLPRADRLVAVGAPPRDELGFGLLPLLATAVRPRVVELDDTESGTRLVRPLGRFLAGAAGPAALQLATSGAALAAQRALAAAPRLARSTRLDSSPRKVVYLRPLVGRSASVGGSVTHTNCVINALRELGVEVLPVTTDRAITGGEIEWMLEDVPFAAKGLPASAALGGDLALVRAARQEARTASFIYQRHARFSLAGVLLSAVTGRPLFLEYNGSEQFFRETWQPTPFGRQLVACETAALRGAAVVIVVAEVERANLVERGLDPAKIVVAPNGVDASAFARGGGDRIRALLGLEDALVAGFVGSFGPWHGAPKLAEAAVRLADVLPDLRLLLVGDGDERASVERILADAGLADRARFVGQVLPADVPSYLDACDVLCSPHVPLPDGRPFFGSPTKLFEYMAAGKPIVASRLGQIEEVLDDGRTALLVEPGDAAQLAEALQRLAADPDLRATLGAAARDRAVADHSWRANVEKVLEAYAALAASSSLTPLDGPDGRGAAPTRRP